MKNNGLIISLPWTTLFVFMAVIGLFHGSVYCQTDGTALLLDKTPSQGGSITPKTGLHRLEPDTEVTLTATPKPGYQFVHWLGDVSNPTTNQTTVYLDAPKIVIAVFERAEFDFAPVELMSESIPMGGLSTTAADYASQGYSGGGRKRPHKLRFPVEPEEEEEPEEEFPVPEEEPEFPVPEIPEPATIILLAMGSLFTLSTKRRN